MTGESEREGGNRPQRHVETRTHRGRMLTVPIVLAGSLAVTGSLTAVGQAHADERGRGRSGDGSQTPPQGTARPGHPDGAGTHDTIAPSPALSQSDRGIASGSSHANATIASVAPQHYTVRSGDTVSGIAEHYGLATSDVLALNGLSPTSTIFPGQRLALTATTSHHAASHRAAGPKSDAEHYTVVAGDTVSDIAAAHGVSTSDVLQANGLDAADVIYPDQRLVIPRTSAEASSTAPASVRASSTQELTDEMKDNARIIIAVGRDENVPDRGIVIALAAAMQESGLRNLGKGDRDSVGLFQQRPSMGWGEPKQLRDARYAAMAFYGGAHNPHPDLISGLLDIPGWKSMSVAEAAQAVQISANPDAYGLWESDAVAWLAALG